MAAGLSRIYRHEAHNGTARCDGSPNLSDITGSRDNSMAHRIFPASAHGSVSVELRFAHRCNDRKSLASPCDALGRVDLDALDERCRNEYLFARALIGHDYASSFVASCNR